MEQFQYPQEFVNEIIEEFLSNGQIVSAVLDNELHLYDLLARELEKYYAFWSGASKIVTKVETGQAITHRNLTELIRDRDAWKAKAARTKHLCSKVRAILELHTSNKLREH